MTEQPSPDDLAKAERAWRWRAEHPRGINLSTGQKVQLRMLLAEFDRLRLVEQAATALAKHWGSVPSSWRDAASDAIDGYDDSTLTDLFDTLAAAVHGETQ